MEEIKKNAEERMEKALASLDREFGKLRTGRASPTLIEDVRVDYYGTPTPIKQIASVSTPDSRSISIQPWDKGSFALIEKALMKSDLGITPVNDGKLIRLVMPPLTEDRRKDLVKVARKYAEEAKVAIRNVRRDANEALKKKEKDGFSEDDVKRAQDEVQKLTDASSAKSEKMCQNKEKEIMEI